MCMIKLPFWRLTNRHPAFYDSESGTVIEQTAKVYAAMQNLTNEFNKYVEDLNTEMARFQEEILKSDCEYKQRLCEIMDNYIQQVDHMLNEAIAYMKNNLDETATQLINEAIERGNIGVATVYNEATEEMDIVATGGV